MAIKLLSTNGQVPYDHNEYAVDTEADLENLPGLKRDGMGSVALVISTGDLYMLNSKGEWVKL